MNSKPKSKNTSNDYTKYACNDSFTCRVCNRLIIPQGAASEHRNHCPYCLSSLHLDRKPGDRRASFCQGVMEAIGVWVRRDGEWAIIHRCKQCGHISSNRIAADDSPLKLMSVALKPLSNPPFPMERIEELNNLMDSNSS